MVKFDLMKRKVNINNNSVEGAGITTDYKQAICEYIWNGFDEGATKISIKYTQSAIGFITAFSIEDNGNGINFETLDVTFGAFLDSVKKEKSYQRSSNIKGKQGKGRYSFKCFSYKAVWHTIYKSEEKFLEYDITIQNDDKDHFEIGEKKIISKALHTGTIVHFYNFHDFYAQLLTNIEFKKYLAQQFGWFLFLNKSRNFTIEINDIPLDYEYIIADSENKSLNIEVGNNLCRFDVAYIRWQEKMGEKYYFYFLDDKQFEKVKIPTSFNNKDNGFHHSVFITSSFFNDFIYEEDVNKATSNPLFGKNQFNPVFKQLMKELKVLIKEKEKLFIRNIGADELIERYLDTGVIPKYGRDSYAQVKRKDLIDTIKEIYCVQPKIFQNIKYKEQEKTLVGFLNLLLDSEEREKVLTILEGVVRMTPKERETLSNVLSITELSKITNLVKLLEERYRVYYALKEAVFNSELGVKEVPDLQRMIENSFWIFGEQYNIVTAAEPDFEEALRRFTSILHGENSSEKKKINHPDKNKEMDIFAMRQNPLGNSIENIVIELKHPSVLLGEKEVNQVKKYMRVILSQGEFNASNMSWIFLLVGQKFNSSGYIEGEIDTNSHHGESSLIFKNSTKPSYKIYVKKWSEIFADFELRHKFLCNKLELKRERLLANAKTKEDLHDIIDAAQTHLK